MDESLDLERLVVELVIKVSTLESLLVDNNIIGAKELEEAMNKTMSKLNEVLKNKPV